MLRASTHVEWAYGAHSSTAFVSSTLHEALVDVACVPAVVYRWQVYNNTDAFGNDNTRAIASNLTACQQQCANTPRCLAGTFTAPNDCFLKFCAPAASLKAYTGATAFVAILPTNGSICRE